VLFSDRTFLPDTAIAGTASATPNTGKAYSLIFYPCRRLLLKNRHMPAKSNPVVIVVTGYVRPQYVNSV
jgi:hypothetical protein